MHGAIPVMYLHATLFAAENQITTAWLLFATMLQGAGTQNQGLSHLI